MAGKNGKKSKILHEEKVKVQAMRKAQILLEKIRIVQDMFQVPCPSGSDPRCDQVELVTI